MIHLRSFELQKTAFGNKSGFPFQLPMFRDLETLEFPSPVTFFVGENGSGKSTMLEALACAIGSITVGSESVNTDPTLKDIRNFSKNIRLIWDGKRVRKGFFLRAEDFFGYARKINQMRTELENDLRETEEAYRDRSAEAQQFARMPYAREIHALESRYGDGLDAQSHGESFLLLFQSRFIPGGLYLLDEPEVPLSPLRQIGFLSLLKQMVEADAQFIIATHSPILLAYPGASIYSFDSFPLQTVEYKDLEHYSLTRDFLNNPESFLRHL
jgi:predicted ATPase